MNRVDSGHRFARREGMILLNVLLIMAVASVAVLVMVATQDIEVQRTTRIREAAQANAYARAGELSAITVLRRDGIEAPVSDNLAEPWANIDQDAISVPGGTFALTIRDDQARFNINQLKSGDPGPIALFQAISEQAEIDPASAIRLASVVRVAGPLTDFSLLYAAGIPPADLARLEAYAVALPSEASLNLNTADQAMLAIVLGDPSKAADLIRRRGRPSGLTSTDLTDAGISLPPGTGLTSNNFTVVTTVRVGDTTQRLSSRLTRRRSDRGVTVDVVGRKRTAG